MGFLAPSLLLGLLAAALPALIHLIGRRRARPLKFAAMQLLLRSERQVSARRKLREVLLLIMRTAIAAALPLVFARPFVERTSDAPVAALDTQSAVLVLDDSASMNRKASFAGGTLFESARDKARAIARQLPSASELALVLASEGSQAPIGELTAEKGRVLDALERTTATFRPADFGAALRKASLLLGDARHKTRRVFVLTDLQDAGWSAPGEPAATARGAELVLLDVSNGANVTNHAVLSVEAELVPELGPGGLAVTAEIASFGEGDAPTNLPVALKIDGTPVARGFVDVPPGGRTRKRFVHTLAAEESGFHDLEVEIAADDLPSDDRRHTRLAVARSLRTLIVNGDAKTVRTEDEAFFLESALRQAPGGTVSVVLPDDVPLGELDRWGVIFLVNVAAPSDDLAAALGRFVEHGGGLFVSVGNKVDAAAWNTRLASLLPQPLGLVRTAAAVPGEVEGEIVDARPAERLAPLDRRHPLLADFSNDGEGLSSARFFKYMLLEPVPDAVGRSVVLRFESGAPALAERQVGRGRVLLLATTVDREWTDLPIRPGFAPLVLEATRRLGGAPDRARSAPLLVGQPRDLTFGAGERRIEIAKPDGTLWTAEQASGERGKAVRFSNTDLPGVYRVRAADASGALSDRPGDTFVVNVDARESVALRLSRERRPDRPAAAAPGQPPPKHRVELWHGLAAALVMFLLVESALTLRRRMRADAVLDPAGGKPA